MRRLRPCALDSRAKVFQTENMSARSAVERIAIVGAGPGGLYLAISLKLCNPSLEVVVHEPEPGAARYRAELELPGDTFAENNAAHADLTVLPAGRVLGCWSSHRPIEHRHRSAPLLVRRRYSREKKVRSTNATTVSAEPYPKSRLWIAV